MEENNLNQHPDHKTDSSEEPVQEGIQDNPSREEPSAPSQEEPKPIPQNNQSQPYYAPWQNPPGNSEQLPHQPTPNYHYQNEPSSQMPKTPTDPMAAASLGLGSFSLLLSCCCFPVGFIIGFVLAMIGLVLAILSKKGKPFSGFAVAGLVISILGICESLFLFFCYLLTAQLMKNPEFAPLINELMEQYSNSIFPQMINSFIQPFA